MVDAGAALNTLGTNNTLAVHLLNNWRGDVAWISGASVTVGARPALILDISELIDASVVA